MYKCEECGCIFEEPKRYSEDFTPDGAFEGGSFIAHWLGCPDCGESYDEAIECEHCGELYLNSELEYNENNEKICQNCMKEENIYNEEEI